MLNYSISSAAMKWSWIFLAILSLAFCRCRSKSAQNELQRKRLLDELQKFNNLTWEYIEEFNQDLTSLKVSEILQDLIDRNISGHEKYTYSCPDRDGIFQFKLHGLQPFAVLCDLKIAGPGWTVVLKRFDGSTNFFRSWNHYKEGFGDLSSEFFIGLDKLHAITYAKPHELYIHLEDFEGNTRYAHYNHFVIGKRTTYYKLRSLGDYSGNAGDALRNNENARFYTFDKDNELACAQNRTTAGWFDRLTRDQNLFGLYLNGNFGATLKFKGLRWDTWLGEDYSLKKVQMMIRPKCSCSSIYD